jgi:STE24 endopeptidase
MASVGLGSKAADSTLQDHRKAKTYNRIKLLSGFSAWVLSFGLLLWLVTSNLSRELKMWANSLTSNDYIALIIFVFGVGLVQTLLTLPIGFYSGYHIEHRYGLSNQSLGRWAWERLKGSLVSLPLVLILLLLLYYCLDVYGKLWWVPAGIAFTFFSIVLARVVPVLIMPLFYKFIPVEDGSLRNRLVNHCTDAGLRIEGVFSFNLSKNTKKANAGFTGIGKSKRIILGDTLVQHFSEEEIETVFAHEVGHYKHRHIVKGIVVGVLSTFIGLGITAQLYEWSLAEFGFPGITDLAALPLLALWLSVYGLVTTPIGNILSRKHERQADSYAVEKTGNKKAFISALRKLAGMNLADVEPHPLIEFLFYSHPSITKRIRTVESI